MQPTNYTHKEVCREDYAAPTGHKHPPNSSAPGKYGARGREINWKRNEEKGQAPTSEQGSTSRYTKKQTERIEDRTDEPPQPLPQPLAWRPIIYLPAGGRCVDTAMNLDADI